MNSQAILWHLACNHYPPVNPKMAKYCEKAIEAGRAGDFGRVITLRNGKRTMKRTAGQIIDDMRLEDFLN